ncbi:MAG: DUF1987 domain-containing protein [Salinivirgaceae bacterium]|jgi:hypothetical protein|nr:DUF1987 domain-containing protein [Salinivirgaceae bacterium]
MENILFNPTEDTPKVVFNFDTGEYMISGRSLPENAVAFYIPLIEWLRKFNSSFKNEIIFNFKLEYFNTASAKQITKILLALQAISLNKEVLIKWYYYIEDMDIKASGERFSKLIKANIELISYDD